MNEKSDYHQQDCFVPRNDDQNKTDSLLNMLTVFFLSKITGKHLFFYAFTLFFQV